MKKIVIIGSTFIISILLGFACFGCAHVGKQTHGFILFDTAPIIDEPKDQFEAIDKDGNKVTLYCLYDELGYFWFPRNFNAPDNTVGLSKESCSDAFHDWQVKKNLPIPSPI